IVHLEAVKIGSQPLERRPKPLRLRLLHNALGLAGTVAIVCALYYLIRAIQMAFGAEASWLLALLGAAAYLTALWYASRYPDLELDDPSAPIVHLPRAWDVTRTGLDFILPLFVLLWCLMVEQLSPGLSAFWGTVTILGIL